ncbi:MAG: hypothetical protein R3B96_07185 [Pirellulaceae bacterium]
MRELLPIITAGERQGDGMVRPLMIDDRLAARRNLIEGLVDGDVTLLTDEGWSMPSQVDESTRDFLSLLTRIPA